MLGDDTRCSGQGYGEDLYVDALMCISRAADQIGSAVVILDVLNCGDADVERRRRLYVSYRFAPLPSQPLRLFPPIGIARGLLS